MTNKGLLKLIVGLIIAIVAAFVVRGVVIGHPVVNLAPAPPLAGAVAQTFTVGSSTTLPVYGTDFTLKNIRYFNNKQWVVVTVDSVRHNFDPGILVMKKVNGAYQAVLGPGSLFSSSYKISLPSSVGNYLDDQGYLHG